MQGKTIKGFTLQRLLGTGGMAEVWYAENEIHKRAAVKILNPELSHNETLVKRFRREAEIMVQLEHPNIRSAYSLGDIDGRPAMIMEYLEGTDLKKMLGDNHRFTKEELVKWWNQLVDALNYTHQKGIVHRDIKPSNIFVDAEGNAKLLDFGIAKVRDSISATQTGQKLGTLMYMSPEQVRDPKRVGAASDAYSLAVTFVHLLTGKAPYDSTTDSDYDIQESIVRKPLDLSAVPKAWDDFLDLYLEKDPNKRPALQHYAKPADAPELDNDGEIEVTVMDTERGTAGHKTPAGRTPTDTPSVKGLHSGSDPLSPTSNDTPKRRKALWIGLAIAAVVALLVLLLRPKPETPTDPDTQAFEACETMEDYRAYMRDYGDSAQHYADAKAYVDRYEADSIATADSLALVMQETMALAQAQHQAEAEAQTQAESGQAEDEAYKNCTTVAACEEYLKTYPEGRYMEEVKAKKAELEAKAVQIGVSCSANGHDYVDLGLPSGTLWATCNMGASKAEDYGNYYAWGETATKETYTLESYCFGKGSDYYYDPKLTKYCNKTNYGNNGFTDNLTVLQSEDDPASAWGSEWSTPTKEQWEELLQNTTGKMSKKNGIVGWIFVANNGETLFLPAAGYRYNSELGYTGTRGDYWSRSLCTNYPNQAWRYFFRRYEDGFPSIYPFYRQFGFSIRPVCKKID